MQKFNNNIGPSKKIEEKLKYYKNLKPKKGNFKI